MSAAQKAASVRAPQLPVDGNHAVVAGYVAGLLIRHSLGSGLILTADLVDDVDGNHTDAVRITAPSGVYLVSIEKEI